MELTRRNFWVYALLAALLGLVVVWQIEEHLRVQEYARNSLRNRSKAIANTLGSFIRGLQFRGAVFGDRLQPVLEDLVHGGTNELVSSGEVLSVTLLNAKGERVAQAGTPEDLEQSDILQKGERWGLRSLTVIYPIEGASVTQEGSTNAAPILLPPFTNTFRDGPRGASRRDGRPPPPNATNFSAEPPPPPPPDGDGRPPGGEPRPRRPFWARGLNDQDYQALIQKRELHGVVLSLSTENYLAIARNDLWLRFVIGFFATISVVGSGLAWRNLAKSSDLQMRLIRASELNTHLKEMNVAAAGLAHETRNPLNIIRGLAQMIARSPETVPEVREKSKGIVDQADIVAAQLNEFINYSRPREVRRSRLALGPALHEIVRTLSFDLEEKKTKLILPDDAPTIEADEQLLRQAVFNLLLNAIQAVDQGGEIQVVAGRQNASEAFLEVRDNGAGVPPDRRQEIFKPYFTTQKTGTGLGLAVVQQIVLAHGWEIQCLPNEPRGAVFRITHIKLAANGPAAPRA
jgi:signal transduction histidine kinase